MDLFLAWDEVTGTRLDMDTGLFLSSTSRLIEQGPELWQEVADVARAASTVPDLFVDESLDGFRWL